METEPIILLPDDAGAWPAEKLAPLLTPRLNKYIKQEPLPKQVAFLLLDDLEVFFGGAGGGSKTSALLMAALQYADVPGYAALLVRRTFTELSQPGALMDRSHDWLDGTDARWDGANKQWRFPGGGVLQFGYMENREDEQRYRSAEYQYVGVDEATTFDERQFRFLFSRLRRLAGVTIPIRMRSASNPGGRGHSWVKKRYVDPETREPGVYFIRATLDDNPYIDRAEYARTLEHLDPVTRARILKGDWTVRESGQIFRREWFEIVEAASPTVRRVRAWDLAASTDGKRTAGVKLARTDDGTVYIEHVIKGKWTPGARDRIIRQTAEADGVGVEVVIEQEPGSGGVAQVEAIIKSLDGYTAHAIRATGEKLVRAGPLASRAEIGLVKLARGQWNADFLDEAEAFPEGQYCDQIDAAAHGYERLAGVKPHAGFFEYIRRRAEGLQDAGSSGRIRPEQGRSAEAIVARLMNGRPGHGA